ncbi:MAG TPA: NAD(P)-dependent oxidoreductase [Candidatus Saccharibacteria bacterium]|nr:NAD(P)-dependent oxidoreductase [Candidatus Saccharibacteria bacterium]
MAKIVVYDVTVNERKAFASFEKDNQVLYIEGPLSLENIVTDADIVSVFVSSKMSAQIIGRFARLRLIAARSTGFNNIDASTAQKKGIAIASVPNYGEYTVTEYTFALILMINRRLRDAINQVQIEKIDSDLIHGNDLHGKTLGVVGAGRIGRHVARVGKAFGMKVVIYDPYVNETVVEKMGCLKCSLNDLLRESDVVTLHTPLTTSNKHMIGKAQFDQMKSSAIFINTARGELVDTMQLVKALKNGKLAGAGLDVLEDERLLDLEEEEVLITHGRPTNISLEHALEINILKTMPNVVITSHNAYNTVEAISRINDTTADNIKAFLSGKPVNIVSNG